MRESKNEVVPQRKCANSACRELEKAGDTVLKACSKCKAARYCSRKCQVSDWVSHKSTCVRNVHHATELQNADSAGYIHLGLPAGMSLTQMDEKLRKWIKFHKPLLLFSVIHALRLSEDVSRSQKFALRIELSPRDPLQATPTSFMIMDAGVVEEEAGRELGTPWRDIFNHLSMGSAVTREGPVAAIGIECRPLDVQMVPFGSLEAVLGIERNMGWKEVLVRFVREGRKFV